MNDTQTTGAILALFVCMIAIALTARSIVIGRMGDLIEQFGGSSNPASGHLVGLIVGFPPAMVIVLAIVISRLTEEPLAKTIGSGLFVIAVGVAIGVLNGKRFNRRQRRLALASASAD